LLTELDVSVVNEIVENVKSAWNETEEKEPPTELFGLFRPMPKELEGSTKRFSAEPEADVEKVNSDKLVNKYGTDNWYDWRIENWGTKWDVSWCDVIIEERTETSVKLRFRTAWGPPIELYDYLVERGIGVSGYYVETGCDFIGCYVNGSDGCNNSIMDADDFFLKPFAEYLLECCISEDEEEDYFDDKENLEEYRAYRTKLKSLIREGDKMDDYFPTVGDWKKLLERFNEKEAA